MVARAHALIALVGSAVLFVGSSLGCGGGGSSSGGGGATSASSSSKASSASSIGGGEGGAASSSKASSSIASTGGSGQGGAGGGGGQGGMMPACPPGFVLCSGACVDPSSNESFCGASGDCTNANAGEACMQGELCLSGSCQVFCPPGFVVCGGACVDPSSNPTYCGASSDCMGANAGATCSAGQLCMGGQCEVFCPPGFVDCGGACVDPSSNNTYCGATSDCSGMNAGATCANGETCVSGQCTLVCPQGFVACGGTCIDPTSNNSYCGATSDCQGANAGKACGVGSTCFDSQCGASTVGSGRPCQQDSDCPGGVCTIVGQFFVCSTPCTSTTECISGWSCEPVSGRTTNVCTCTVSQETCDGKDNDCDGAIDDGSANGVCSVPGYECSNGSCVCGTTCGGSTCVDTQNDNANCGGCGVVCTGTCNSGHCLTILASGRNSPNGVAVDATNVYWTEGPSSPGFVESVPIAGGAVKTVLAGTPGKPTALVLQGSDFYFDVWSPGAVSGVMHYAIGGSPTFVLTRSSTPPLVGLFVDSKNAYWTTGDIVVTTTLGGTNLANDVGTNPAGAVTSTASYVYWSSNAGTCVPLGLAAIGSSSPMQMLAAPCSNGGIVSDAANVYWTTQNGVAKTSAGNTTSGSLFVYDPFANGPMAVDATSVYWVSAGAIKKVSLAGGLPETLAINQTPTALALDANNLYWVSSSAGTVSKAPK